MKEKIPKNPIQFGMYATKPHKKWAILALLFVFIATGVGRFTVLILSNLTDAIAASPVTVGTVWLWAVAYPVVYFTAENFWRLSGFTGMRWFMNFYYTGYQSLYEYLTLHSKDYFNSRFAGSLVNKINNAVEGTQYLFERILWEFLPLLFSLFWFTGFAFYSDYRLGAILAVWAVLFLSMNVWFARRLQPRSYTSALASSTLKGRVVDSLSNISLVHEYAYVAGEREYIKQFVKKDRDAGMVVWRLSEWMLFANGVMIAAFMFTIIGTSVYLFQEDIVSAGTIVLVIAISLKLSDQLMFLGQEIKDATRFYGEAEEGLEEIVREHHIVDVPSATSFIFTKGEIALEKIGFEYDNVKVFSDFSLHITAGQKIGLVGKSGAGKSTFVSLLLRHYEVTKGSIMIDGQDISMVKLESLRSAVAFVPQDTSLFHRTIKENIRYSNPDATGAQVIRAARLAQADEFIQRLPHGYETLVGERGVKLSGGQRQRIAIARAFLKDAPILILDEATSSLDSESEHAIQESLETLMKGRTVIAIAHRLSTLKKMDRLILIEDGKIIEDGTPEQLLQKKNGAFRKLWDHQVKGFIVED